MSLKENYKDDILDTSQNTKRKYDMIENPDGTISLDDVTEYLQEGDSFGADDINGINHTINNLDICETYTSGENTLVASIDNYVAQANMSDKSQRRIVIICNISRWIVDITRDGDNYTGIAIRTDTTTNSRWTFSKQGSSTTTVDPFSTTHTDTYTYPSGSTGGTYDMGVSHTYRYVNASNVYTKGKADGKTVHSTTYTYPSGSTGATYDMGTDHTYRYVNATNVYTKGKTDGASGKITPNYAYVTSKSYELDASTNGKMTFSATSGYVYAVAYGGGGHANTTSLTVSGGTLLGVKVLKVTLDGKAYCTLLAIVKATSTSVTVYPNGSNPTSGIGIVSRVGV